MIRRSVAAIGDGGGRSAAMRRPCCRLPSPWPAASRWRDCLPPSLPGRFLASMPPWVDCAGRHVGGRGVALLHAATHRLRAAMVRWGGVDAGPAASRHVGCHRSPAGQDCGRLAAAALPPATSYMASAVDGAVPMGRPNPAGHAPGSHLSLPTTMPPAARRDPPTLPARRCDSSLWGSNKLCL
jgi:hypothetical protein